MLAQTEIFPEQVSTEAFLDNLLYILATTAVVLVVAGLILILMGAARRRNVVDVVVQPLVGFLIATVAFLIVGYGIWQWQFYDGFAIANPYGRAIEDWWIGGPSTNARAQNLDPAIFPAHNTFQIFAPFVALYAGFVCVMVYFGGAERLKALAYYIMCAGIGAVFYPILLWLTWGSLSPVTNAGVHDFVGVFVGYIFAGTFALVLAWRLGPRVGVLKSQAVLAVRQAPYNVGLAGIGVVVLLFAIPFVVIGCGYWFPDVGYFGISMTTTSIGIVFQNIFISYAAGGIVGALIAYRTKNVLHALLGPLAGYIAGTAAFDVVKPWEMLVIALFAPLFVWAVYAWLQRVGIDETKIVPLGLGAGVYGAIVTGFVAWGDGTGGFLGIQEGAFAFQNAEINAGWQLVGVAIAIGTALVAALFLIIGVEKTIGLRVSEEDEVKGLDLEYWNSPPDIDGAPGGERAGAATPPLSSGSIPERPTAEA